MSKNRLSFVGRSRFLAPQRGFVWQSILSGIGFVLAAVFVIAFTFGTSVPPGALGIRQVKLGPGQGFSTEALSPGYHWSVPGYSVVHVLPAAVRVVNLNREAKRGEFDAVDVQTSDGATVDVDISILNRLFTEAGTVDGMEHGGPRELVISLGLSPAIWNERLRAITAGELRRTLGRLNSADFYDPGKRESALTEAEAEVKKAVAPFGLKIEGILLRRYTYRSERINDAIFQKNLQEVDERLNAAKSRLAEAKAELEEVAARLDARIETLKVEGENRASVLRAEGDRLDAELRAQGDLLVTQARADIDRQRAEVLSEGRSSQLLVARELAPLLGTLRGGVVSGVDPYDLEQWMKRFGVGGGRP